VIGGEFEALCCPSIINCDISTLKEAYALIHLSLGKAGPNPAFDHLMVLVQDTD
jgi:hypothetical protein